MVQNKIYIANPDNDDDEERKKKAIGVLNVGWCIVMHASTHSNKVSTEFIGKTYCITSYTETKRPISQGLKLSFPAAELARWIVKEECFE